MGVQVRQKPADSGIYWVFIHHDGRRTSKRIGTSEDKANEVAENIRAKLVLGQYNFDKAKKQPQKTFGQYAKTWLENTVPATCKESTADDYKNIMETHIKPVFEDMNLQDITRGRVKDFLLSKINEGKAPSTVKHMKSVISGVLSKALDDEVIKHNPARDLGRIFKNGDKAADINPLSADELNTLLKKVEEKYAAHYPLFLLLARTGVRIGEAVALKWKDIDFNGRFIEVRRAIVRGRKSTPKSGKGRRVDMSKQLVTVLKKHRKAAKAKGLELGLGEEPEHVFTNRAGNPVDSNVWRRRVFNKALEKAEIRQIRIHDLRHTYATLRIAKGDNIADVSNQLGHYSVKLTLDIYYHWIPGKNKAEVDGLDDLHLNAPQAHPEAQETKKEASNVG